MQGPIFLIGFMCSGKTTLGQALAKASGMDFVDLDQKIEAEAGMSVNAIFASEGEKGFRQREKRALAECLTMNHAIIATGGGTPCQPGIMEIINNAGLSVHLKPNMHRLVSRLMDGRAQRPLLSSISTDDEMWSFAEKKLDQRSCYYQQAKLEFDSSWLETPEEINNSVTKLISLLSNK